jgi:hypothetical protein
VTARLDVIHGWADPDDELAKDAAGVRDEYVPWLAEHHPELGISSTTAWRSVVTKPRILVVSHHLFFSEEWEMGVRWHVMIPPHDWTEIYLRHRWDEMRPSHAFKIRSRSAGDDPVPVEPEDAVWR